MALAVAADRDPDDFLDGQRSYEQKEIGPDELNQRLIDWLKEAQSHAGEIVLAFDARRVRNRIGDLDIHIGTIDPDLSALDLTGEIENPWIGFQITTGNVAWVADDRHIISSAQPIRFSTTEVHTSFQIVRDPYRRDEESRQPIPSPQYEVVIGNEAVAEWFKQDRHAGRYHQYYLVCRDLGLEPVMSPELVEAVDKKRMEVLGDLLESAFAFKDTSPLSWGQGKMIKEIETLTAKYLALSGTQEELTTALLEILGLQFPTAEEAQL